MSVLGNDRLSFDHLGGTVMQHGEVGVRLLQLGDDYRKCYLLLVPRHGGTDTRHTRDITWSRCASDLWRGG